MNIVTSKDRIGYVLKRMQEAGIWIVRAVPSNHHRISIEDHPSRLEAAMIENNWCWNSHSIFLRNPLDSKRFSLAFEYHHYNQSNKNLTIRSIDYHEWGDYYSLHLEDRENISFGEPSSYNFETHGSLKNKGDDFKKVFQKGIFICEYKISDNLIIPLKYLKPKR